MIWVGNVIHKDLNGKDYLEDLGMDGVDRIKMDVKQNELIWINLAHNRDKWRFLLNKKGTV